MTSQKTVDEASEDFYEKFDLYVSMAHFVGKTLKIRPNEILDGWGVPELVVAYGHYANEITSQNFEQWKSLDTKTRIKVGKPSQYAVRFHGTMDDEDE